MKTKIEKLVENLLKEAASYLNPKLFKLIPQGIGYNDWGSGKFRRPYKKFKIKGYKDELFLIIDIEADNMFSVCFAYENNDIGLEHADFLKSDISISNFEKVCKYLDSSSIIDASKL